MIRKLQKVDINRVADIWLKTNLKAHYFIPEQYWTNNYEVVKEMLPQAEVYVYEDDKIIQGFNRVKSSGSPCACTAVGIGKAVERS